MRLLIAEDDAPLRETMEKSLTIMGYDVMAVSDGAKAFEILQKRDAPLVAILDWKMPKMTGPDVCRKIRELDKSIPTYFILLTAFAQKEEVVKGLESGANDYITKPFEYNELKARIDVGFRIATLESELKKSLDYAENITSSMTDMLFVLNADGFIQTVNPAAANLLGYTENELVGIAIETFIKTSEPDSPSIIEVNEGNFRNRECILIQKDSSEFSVLLSGAVLKETGKSKKDAVPDSQIAGKVLVAKDITDLKHAEAEVKEAEADLAYHAGFAEMSSSIVHNIGNILGPVGIAAEGMKKHSSNVSKIADFLSVANNTDDTSKRKKMIYEAEKTLHAIANEDISESMAVINDGVKHIDKIIRLQQNVTTENVNWLSKIDVNDYIENAISFMEEVNTLYQIEVTTDLDKNIGELMFQKNSFIQLLVNLVKNAGEAIAERMRNNEKLKGEIYVVSKLNDNDTFTLSVKDNGCGIPNDKLNEIFAFGFTTKDSSNGYGLHTAANFVQSIKGSIEAKSEGLNQGAQFVVTLPVVIGD